MRAPIVVCVFDQREFLGGEPARLEQYGVRNADLADVVQWRCAPHQVDLLVVPPQHTRERRRELADAADVIAGRVIAILGCLGEPVERVDACLVELGGADAHALLELHVVLQHLLLERTDREQVADAQQRLELVERLGEKVRGALLECAQLRLREDVGGEHEDRQVRCGRRRALADLLQYLEPVETGHVQVEQHDVGLPRVQQLHHALRL